MKNLIKAWGFRGLGFRDLLLVRSIWVGLKLIRESMSFPANLLVRIFLLLTAHLLYFCYLASSLQGCVSLYLLSYYYLLLLFFLSIYSFYCLLLLFAMFSVFIILYCFYYCSGECMACAKIKKINKFNKLMILPLCVIAFGYVNSLLYVSADVTSQNNG